MVHQFMPHTSKCLITTALLALLLQTSPACATDQSVTDQSTSGQSAGGQNAGNARPDAPRPNILVILADDIGYSDIGCYGGEINTPTLDTLAEEGLRFTQFYNAGRCCPTRASLLTGLYPHQAGVGWMIQDSGQDGYRGDLNRRCVTLAEVLGGAGYETYMAGKWHVTPAPTHEQYESDAVDKHNWPRARGFQHFYGTIAGAGSYYDPATLVRDDTLIPPENPADYYYTDAISDNVAANIRKHDRVKPFFMVVAYTAAHWPLHAKADDLAKYEGRYDEGWDALREERHRRMKELGLIGENVGLAPHVRDWDSEERKKWQSQRMEAYAAMIDSMDQGIGRVVTALKESGQYDNTLILYLQDNGACQEEMKSSQARQKRDKMKPRDPTPDDELQFDPSPDYTRSGQPVKWGRGVVPGPADTYMEVGIEWANASNTPFRLFKHFVHEGGIATPLIAHWPQGIQRKGDLETTPAHLIDIMPTLVDLAGATYPETFHEEAEQIQSPEGVSLTPAFAGEPVDRDAQIFWEHEGNRAVRDGDWKLVARGEKGKWQLYNLTVDRSELNDMAHEQPERVIDLSSAWQAWAVRANVLPLTPYIEKPPEEEAVKNGASAAN